MALLVDLFGYLGIILHGVAILAQSFALGGVLFLLLIARPTASQIGAEIERRAVRLAVASALLLAGEEVVALALQTAVLSSTLEMPPWQVLAANFAVAGLVRMVAALLLAWLLARRAGAPLLLATSAIVLLAATMTTHAVARLDDNAILFAVELLHQFGAAIWVGGIPYFVIALARLDERGALRAVGTRFSRMSMAGWSRSWSAAQP